MVQHVLVAVGDHGAALVPAAAADDVHGVGGEGVGAAHDRADVHVVLPVLDRDVKRVPRLIEVGDDGLHAPVAVAVDDVAAVAALEQLGVVARVVGPLGLAARPRPDAVSQGGFGRRIGFHRAESRAGRRLVGLEPALVDRTAGTGVVNRIAPFERVDGIDVAISGRRGRPDAADVLRRRLV